MASSAERQGRVVLAGLERFADSEMILRWKGAAAEDRLQMP